MWKYIKVIWEGDDGKLSIRRVTSCVFTALIVRMILSDGYDTDSGFKTIVSLELTVLLMMSVITADNLIKFVRGGKRKEDEL